MQHALYGRMARGECVKTDNGLGCYANELNFMDKVCSGKQSCELFIPNQEMTARLDCLNEMSPYLEASFKCQQG